MQANTTGATAISIALKRRNKRKTFGDFLFPNVSVCGNSLYFVRNNPSGTLRVPPSLAQGRQIAAAVTISAAKLQLPTAPKLTCSNPFSNTACYCELAVQHPFFETSQSCVSTKVTLSHRFKSSPAIPGNLAMPGAAGYMMMAGHFRQNLVSNGDLNRPRSPEVRKPLACFLVLFARRKKNVKTSSS